MKKAQKSMMFGAVTVGQRGQIVIPAKARKDFRIKPGDKLLVFAKRTGTLGLVPLEKLTKILENNWPESNISKEQP